MDDSVIEREVIAMDVSGPASIQSEATAREFSKLLINHFWMAIQRARNLPDFTSQFISTALPHFLTLSVKAMDQRNFNNLQI